MAWPLRGREDRVLRAARQSQAVVIEITERLSRDRQERPRPLGRLWKTNLDLAGAVADPAQAIDEAYALAQRLVALHREFAHRLLEAMDTREPPEPLSGAADVLPFVRRTEG